MQSAPELPGQQEFRQHLRELARSGIRLLLEAVMREELDALIGVGWGESSPQRKGYRNGYYSRDLVTSSGRIEELQVPRDREGQFHTQVFDRYSRYEPQVAQGLTEMFVAGVSTHKVREVTQTLMGVAKSASAISRLKGDLEHQFQAWRERSLQEHWRILYLDGVHFSVRHGDQADHDPDGIRCGPGWQQRSVGEALVRRGEQRWLAELVARPAKARGNADGSHRDRRP